jgi:hypothetical protein
MEIYPMSQWFFAYPSKPSAVGDILKGIKANTPIGQRTIQIWEENDISGRPLTDPIFESISACEIFFADVTKLNFNVTFEIGYAIGKGKSVELLVNKGLVNDGDKFEQIGIFDTLGYRTYENSQQLIALLSQIQKRDGQNTKFSKNEKSPIYILETPQKNEAMTRIISNVKKTRLRYRSFNSEEMVRLSATDAIFNTSTSLGIVVPLLSVGHVNQLVHNLRAAFVAGLGLGLNIPTLILQDHEGPAPLDVRDLVKNYRHPDDISDIVQELALQVTDLMQEANPTPKDDIPPLARLTIGDPMAENEMLQLENYFVETDAYHRTLRGEVNIVVGRKGNGENCSVLSS